MTIKLAILGCKVEPIQSRFLLLLLIPALMMSGCSRHAGGYIEGEPQPAVVYPLASDVFTALQQVWGPKHPTAEVAEKIKNGQISVYDHAHYDDHGLGAVLEPGLPWIEHTELAPDFEEGSRGTRRSLAYMWLVADPQIIDEESPIRMEAFSDVYRPHGHLTPQVFEAHVRTAQRISELSSRPYDFAVLPGDLTDTGQKNEVDWLLTTLNGGVIDPDSGVDNDPVPGPGNDYNDPFISDGIDTPWYPALGNHDTLYMGGFGLVNDKVRAAAVSDRLYLAPLFGLLGWNGFLACDTVNAKLMNIVNSRTPADSERLPLTITEVLQTLRDADGEPVGHGFTQDDVDNARGYYAVYPVPGKPIKMIVLNTSNPNEKNVTIAFQGSMDATQFSWFEQQLTLAQDNNELVIVVSHHRLEDFHNLNGMKGSQVSELIGRFDNVALMLTGHGHQNTKRVVELSSGTGYWQLMSASTVDFPLQSRILEFVDEGNGFLSIYVTNLDHNSTEDSLAHKARHLAGGKKAFGNAISGSLDNFWENDKLAQNLLLRIKVPADVSNNLAQHSWSSVIESEETLNQF